MDCHETHGSNAIGVPISPVIEPLERTEWLDFIANDGIFFLLLLCIVL